MRLERRQIDMLRMLVTIAALVLLAAVAVGATCFGDEATEDPEALATVGLPTFFPSPGPTLPWKGVLTGVAENIDEAASFAREQLDASPPLGLREPDSMFYVRATVGQARDLFDPERRSATWDTPDEAPAVIFVAYGRFQILPPVALNMTPAPPFSTVWVVVPLGVEGTRWVATNDQYDLSVFGEVGELEVPLPEWPTPVEFRTKVDGP
jgi:hypothetical protein